MTSISHTPRKASIEKNDVILLFLVVVFLYLLLFKLPFFPIYHDGDQLIFVDDADRMLHGETLYRDFFQFTFPGTQVWYCLLFLIFGVRYWVLGFSVILAGSLSFWFCLRISKRLIGSTYAYLPGTLFAFFGLRWFGLDGSHRAFSPLLVLIAVWLVLRSGTYLHLMLAGLFCALSSFFTQQRGVTALAAIVVFLLVDNYHRGWRWKQFLAESLTVASAFTVSFVLMCSYFVVTAGFETFVWSTLTYPAKYYKYFQYNNFGAFWVSIKLALAPGARIGEFAPVIFYSLLIPLSLSGFFIVYLRYRKQDDWSFWRGPMLVAIVGSFLLMSTTAPNAWRLFNISVPALILFSWMLDYLDVFGKQKRIAAAGVVGVVLMVSIFLVIRFQAQLEYIPITSERGNVRAFKNEQNDRYLWVQEHTKPGDYILEAPYQGVYFLLGLKHAARYSQFVQTEYTRPEFVTGTVEDLRTNRARYIIWVNDYNKPAPERSPGDNLGPLSDFIISEYVPNGPIYHVASDFYSEIQVWERRAEAER